MAVQDYKINYKSDFVLNINGDAGWATQFCIKFWTGMPSQAYFVGFDGVKYVNCRVGDTPTQLLVMFDDHHLPIGKLKMQIAYHTTIEEFPGSVFDEVTNARDVIVTIDGTDYQVLLDFTGEDAPEMEFDLPAYANEAERIQNELQRQQNEADRIAAELQREQATAAAVQGAENVNAQLNGTTLTVTNRNGVSTSVNTKGEQGVPGPEGPEGQQGEQGETGISIVSFTPKSETSTTLIYTVTFSDGHTQDVPIPKGAKGDTGATGPQGQKGDTGVSITAFTYASETETDMIYTVTFSDSTTQQVAIPKGEKGDQGPVGPQGPQGPMGDVAVITPEQQAAFTMYSTTGQNTDGPMTQKAVTDALVGTKKEIADFTEVVSSSLYTRINFIIVPSRGKWLTAGSTQGSKLVAIPSGVKEIILSPNSDIMMWTFLSAYKPPSNGASVSVATGTDNRYSATEETRINSWGNGKFILVRDDNGQTGSNAYFPNITFVYYDHIEARIAEVQQDISDLSKNAIADDGVVPFGALYGGYVQDNGTWLVQASDNTHLSSHYAISIFHNELYRIDAGNSDCVVCWATSHERAVNGAQVPMVGVKISVKANTSKVIKAPSTASYLLVMAAYYTKDIKPSQIVMVSNGESTNIMNVIPDYIVKGEELINLDELTQYNYSMVAGGVWGSTLGIHKAIPVVAGEKYVISGDGNGFWAWMTSSYSPPVTSGAQVPFVTGYTNRILQKGAVAVTVPDGAAFIAITTVNGGGGTSNWEIYKVSDYKKRSVNFTKFRMAHWNIGQFVYTDWTVDGPTHKIPAADAETYAQKYKSLFNSVNADILGISEYDPVYSAAEWNTKNTLFKCFRSMYEGTKTGANCNSIAYNLCEFVGVEEINFTASAYNRYYTHITARLNGENIHLVQAHLDHTYNEMRVAEINQLIAEMSPFEYVIIGGDFNTGDEETVEEEYALFTNDGYTILNDGYLGLLVTSLTQEYVDNIIVKGFTMSNLNVREDSGTLSDHLLIYCDLSMN